MFKKVGYFFISILIVSGGMLTSCVGASSSFRIEIISPGYVIAQQDLEIVGVFSYRVSSTIQTERDASGNIEVDDYYIQALKQAREEFGEDVDIVDLNLSLLIDQSDANVFFTGAAPRQEYIMSGRVVRIKK